MQSKATNVDIYLKEIPAERLSALIKLRELSLKQLKGYEEVMEYANLVIKRIILLKQDLLPRHIFLPYSNQNSG